MVSDELNIPEPLDSSLGSTHLFATKLWELHFRAADPAGNSQLIHIRSFFNFILPSPSGRKFRIGFAWLISIERVETCSGVFWANGHISNVEKVQWVPVAKWLQWEYGIKQNGCSRECRRWLASANGTEKEKEACTVAFWGNIYWHLPWVL